MIASASFVWNVWSKFIYPKSRVRVTFGIMTVVGDGKIEGQSIGLGATNMGPAEVTLHNAIVKGRRRLFRKRAYEMAILKPLHNYPMELNRTLGPFSGGLPKKLAVGEQFSVHLILPNEGLATDDWSRIGFVDTFGKLHWASRRVTKSTRADIAAWKPALPPKQRERI